MEEKSQAQQARGGDDSDDAVALSQTLVEEDDKLNGEEVGIGETVRIYITLPSPEMIL